MRRITKKTLRLDKSETLKSTLAGPVDLWVREQVEDEAVIPTERIAQPIQTVVESEVGSKLRERKPLERLDTA
jgi:hypothetical protein